MNHSRQNGVEVPQAEYRVTFKIVKLTASRNASLDPQTTHKHGNSPHISGAITISELEV